MNSDLLTELQEDWLEAKMRGLTQEEIEANPELLTKDMNEEIDAIAAAIVQRYQSTAPQVLKRTRSNEAAFQERNFARWRKAFDILEIMVSVATDLGELNEKSLLVNNTSTVARRALSDLYPRAILITREILALLKAGYPDGALARWRSLHEIAVTMMFIAKHGDQVGLPFILSFPFKALKRARNFNQHAERSRLKPFTSFELQKMQDDCDNAERRLGRKLDGDFGWAAPPLVGAPTFAAVEKDVEMDHWRPRFAWACQHNHAGHHPADKFLGLAETKDSVHLVGMSNSGFVDPLDMTAHSLTAATVSLFKDNANFDRLVHMKTMCLLRDQVGPTAVTIERLSLQAWRRKQCRARRKNLNGRSRRSKV